MRKVVSLGALLVVAGSLYAFSHVSGASASPGCKTSWDGTVTICPPYPTATPFPTGGTGPTPKPFPG